MALFDWLKSKPDPDPPVVAQAPKVVAPVDIAALGKRLRLPATLLVPCKATGPLPASESKFGGEPWLGLAGDETGTAGRWPHCPACQVPLTFVLQVFQRDVPTLPLPPDCDLLQVFLCEESECPNVLMGQSFAFYVFCAASGVDSADAQEAGSEEGGSVTECALRLQTESELPSYQDLGTAELAALEAELDDAAIDAQWRPREGSKVGGYPAFIQDNEHPACNQCRQPMQFLLQICSDERQPPRSADVAPFEFAPHELMLGDLGTAYFFACHACAPQVVDTVFQTG